MDIKDKEKKDLLSILSVAVVVRFVSFPKSNKNFFWNLLIPHYAIKMASKTIIRSSI